MNTENKSMPLKSESKLSDEPFNPRTMSNFEKLIDVVESIHGRVNNVDQITTNIQDIDLDSETEFQDRELVAVSTPLDKLFVELHKRLSIIDDNLNRLQHRISI